MYSDRQVDEMRRRLPEIVNRTCKPAKKGFYYCPRCQKDNFTVYDNGMKFKCFTPDCIQGGTFDFIGEVDGIRDFRDQIKRAGEILNITEETAIRYGRSTPQEDFGGHNEDKKGRYSHNMSSLQYKNNEENDDFNLDFTKFYDEAHEHIKETDYATRRGLSDEAIERFKLGYVAEWKLPLESYLHSKDGRTRESWEKIPNAPRLIIPVTKYSYTARDTRDQLTEDQEKFKKVKTKGRSVVSWVFNSRALLEAEQPIFITEGELDAISIIEAGGEAVALGSTAYINGFVETLKRKRPKQPFIIALDNEKEPEKKARIEKVCQKLKEELTKLSIPFYRGNMGNPAGEYKDANDALVYDRAGLVSRVKAITADAITEAEAEREALKEELQRESVAYRIQDFMDNINDSERASFTPSGFTQLDKLLEGGFYPGLYIVGAISALGKTTFCLQIADQIAQSGRDVLIFSLEMSRYELIAKSVSRLTLIHDLEDSGTTYNAKNTRGILTGAKYKYYSDEEIDLINKSIESYKEYAEHIFITEGVGNVGIDEIRERVIRHAQITGQAPVVLIDYLQILAPADPRATDKQNTDKAVLELKRLSRDYDIPVIGISSFNRENYYAPVNLTSFKESGAVEYSSDVLLGLQYQGMDYKRKESKTDRAERIQGIFDDMTEKARAGNVPQPVQVKILKSRNGIRGDFEIEFYPKYNYFREKSDFDTTTGGE